jgi:protein-S-isoprenylcysteine O-methyltransferase Ste14
MEHRRESWFRRTRSDVLLLAVTLVELVRFVLVELVDVSPTTLLYLLQHLVVLGLVLIRRKPQAMDPRPQALALCAGSYAYPYLILLLWSRRDPVPILPEAGEWMVRLSAVLTLWGLLALGSSFGIRPARRQLVIRGPYRIVRHPIYASYFLGDLGFVLTGADGVLLLIFALGWATLLGRLLLEERILSRDPAWIDYAQQVRFRLVPGIY